MIKTRLWPFSESTINGTSNKVFFSFTKHLGLQTKLSLSVVVDVWGHPSSVSIYWQLLELIQSLVTMIGRSRASHDCILTFH